MPPDVQEQVCVVSCITNRNIEADKNITHHRRLQNFILLFLNYSTSWIFQYGIAGWLPPPIKKNKLLKRVRICSVA